MTLSFGTAPLSSTGSPDVNYTIDGPRHRLLFDRFPRRTRASLGGETVLDSTSARLLHESNLLPALYVPRGDVRSELLTPTDHSTHCPFKGDASYWTVTVGDAVAENALWGYPEPIPEAAWLEGYVGVYWDRFDRWFDEDEEVHGHLRDPYHRVDARRSSRQVVVRHGEVELARSSRPVVVSENGLPNRYYLPADDVRTELLAASVTRTHCPYKGWASYWSLVDGPADVAWSYEDPLLDASPAAGHFCFVADGITTEVGGEVV